jgi:hypothetical protein
LQSAQPRLLSSKAAVAIKATTLESRFCLTVHHFKSAKLKMGNFSSHRSFTHANWLDVKTAMKTVEVSILPLHILPYLPARDSTLHPQVGAREQLCVRSARTAIWHPIQNINPSVARILSFVRVCGIARRTPKRNPHHNNLQKRDLYTFIFLKKYGVIKIKDNKLEFRCFLNFIDRKGVLGLCRVVGFCLGVRRAMPHTLTTRLLMCGIKPRTFIWRPTTGTGSGMMEDGAHMQAYVAIQISKFW